MNYASLLTAVQDYTGNTFAATDFATMTQLAEQKIYNSVQMPMMRKTTAPTLSSGVNTVAAPSDFLAPYSFMLTDTNGNATYLINKDLSYIKEAYPTTTTALPKYYAVQGPQSGSELLNQFILGPTPDAAYTASLIYQYYPTSIVTAGNTWLGDNFFSVLMNAVLVETGRYMKTEDDVMKMYVDQYTQSLALFKNLVDGKLRQDAYRSGQLRTQVI
jgi:hypothetical protein